MGLYLNKFVPKKEKVSKESEASWTLDSRRVWDPRLAGLILAGIVVSTFCCCAQFAARFHRFICYVWSVDFECHWNQHEECSVGWAVVSGVLSIGRLDNDCIRRGCCGCVCGKEFQSSRSKEQTSLGSGNCGWNLGWLGRGNRSRMQHRKLLRRICTKHGCRCLAFRPGINSWNISRLQTKHIDLITLPATQLGRAS